MLLFERLSAYLSFSALVTFAVVGAHFSWVLVDEYWLPEVAEAPSVFRPPASTRELPPLNSWNWIDKYNVISPPRRAEPVAQPEPEPEPEPVKRSNELERLNVRLVGLMGRGERAIAIMSVDGNTQTYLVGETVKNDIYLKQVQLDGVLLAEGEAERLVEFNLGGGAIKPYNPEETDDNAGSVITPTNAPAPSTPDNVNVAAAPTEPLSSLPGTVSNELLEIKKMLRTEPVKVANMVRFSQVRKDGELSGMRVQPRVNQALFNSLGFSSGDIITAVNGHSIQDLLTQPALWAGLLNADTYNIELTRDGVSETVTINW